MWITRKIVRSSNSNGKMALKLIVELLKKSGLFLIGSLEVPSNTQFYQQVHVFLRIFSREIDLLVFKTIHRFN